MNEKKSALDLVDDEQSVEKETPVQKEQIEQEKTEDVIQSNSQSNGPTVLVSHTDAYIHERMKAQPRSLKSFDLRVEEKRDPNKHRLSLPDEFKKYQRRYAFRWIFKRKQSIDEHCDVKGWSLVNRTLFPDIPPYYFTVNGSVERGDNILGFIPIKKAKELRELPGQKSKEMIEATLNAHKDKPNFYVPKGEEDDGTVIGL